MTSMMACVHWCVKATTSTRKVCASFFEWSIWCTQSVVFISLQICQCVSIYIYIWFNYFVCL